MSFHLHWTLNAQEISATFNDESLFWREKDGSECWLTLLNLFIKV
jgi:hypothetical protein